MCFVTHAWDLVPSEILPTIVKWTKCTYIYIHTCCTHTYHILIISDVIHVDSQSVCNRYLQTNLSVETKPSRNVGFF